MTTHILTLIAASDGKPLAPSAITALQHSLGTTPVWLAEAQAVELPLTDIDPARLDVILADAFGMPRAEIEADIGLLPAGHRQKQLLISDMDSTMIQVECIDELADMAGVKEEVAAVTHKAMAGELVFEDSLRARVALLEGLPVSIFDEVYAERVQLMPGATVLLRTMKTAGAITALVSGGFVPFAERVKAALGFDHATANHLEAKDGRLTGKVLEPIAGPDIKEQILRRLCQDHGLRSHQTLAVGDGANDVPMLKAAGLGVAFRAHAPVAAAADASIAFGDLSAVLYLQGIPKNAFIED